MMNIVLVLLLQLQSAVIVIASSTKCATLSAFAMPNLLDPTPIFVGGGGNPSLWPNTALFMSSQYAYRVDINSSGALVVQQADIGQYQSTAAAVGVYANMPIILHLIPTGSTDMHYLAIKDSQLYQKLPPHPLGSVINASFVPNVATTLANDPAGTLDIFFANAYQVVRVCPTLGQAHGQSVFDLSANFDNPLDVDEAFSIEADLKVRRVFIARRKSGSTPDDAADVVVLQIPAGTCRLVLDNRVFVQPQPTSLSVLGAMSKIGAYLYWPMAPDPNNGPEGRLYRWDLLSARVGVGNISLGMSVGDVISPVGFAKLFHYGLYYGLVVSHTPGDMSVWATMLDAGDSVYNQHKFRVICQSYVGMNLPTAYAPMGGRSRILFVGDDQQFTLVDVPFPTSQSQSNANLQKRTEFSNTTAVALAQCPSYSFGLPATCSACTPPTAVCGMTEHCSSGCCFVSGGRVLCCTQSPPGTSTSGFSCAIK
jgi:hypothetical protein